MVPDIVTGAQLGQLELQGQSTSLWPILRTVRIVKIKGEIKMQRMAQW